MCSLRIKRFNLGSYHELPIECCPREEFDAVTDLYSENHLVVCVMTRRDGSFLEERTNYIPW